MTKIVVITETKSYLTKNKAGRRGKKEGRETLIYTHCLFNSLGGFLLVFLQKP